MSNRNLSLTRRLLYQLSYKGISEWIIITTIIQAPSLRIEPRTFG